MSNYSKITDYAAKDLLLHLDPAKAIKGTEVGAEFDAIATMSATKLDVNNIHAASSKATPVDADELPLADSATSFSLKKLTWANLKAVLQFSSPSASKATPVDADAVGLYDSAATTTATKLTWANLKTTLGKITVQRFLSGSGTYTTPAGCIGIKITMCGGGGGGSGSGSVGSTAATSGVTSTFGTSLLTAPNGTLASFPSISTCGGAGGVAPTINSPALTVVSLTGSNGGGAGYIYNTSIGLTGGDGGSNSFGGPGAGGGSISNTAGDPTGKPAIGNSGGGGGGGGLYNGAIATGCYSGNGGGAGAYLEAIIVSPSGTYSYSVGAGGSAGAAGTNGADGGAGGSGIIIVEEYYG